MHFTQEQAHNVLWIWIGHSSVQGSARENHDNVIDVIYSNRHSSFIFRPHPPYPVTGPFFFYFGPVVVW